MAVPKRATRLKQIIQGLRNDANSQDSSRTSAMAYSEGRSTTLDEMANYVRLHRPSANNIDLRAMEAEHLHSEELVQK